ncbi:rCG34487 [Rattus norvegicus]|uniref:RCG34487 n=1 Tax=Rattus norvegicus TaxID=10116 RepID=A6HGP5_RAT|nr:rCG34487 [Rattus norvegicus]
MGPSRALPSVLSPNSSNVKLSDSVTKVSGFHRMMVKWLSRLDLPSPMMRVQKDGIQLNRLPAVTL